MAVVTSAPAALSRDLSLFHTTDPLLSNSPVLIFHGPAATIGATSSRIQIHVFTPAGCATYPRLAVSPNSPFYTAVSNLPREEQGDEVIRGLAFGLKKYFAELSDALRKTWCTETKAPSAAALFGDDHVAILASRMTRVENVNDVMKDISRGFGEQRLSWLDVDVVLPSGSIKRAATKSVGHEDSEDAQMLVERYGKYAELVDSLGELAFLPTSKIKRAPSKPSAIGRSASFLQHQKDNVEKEICELLHTEERYVERMMELKALPQTLAKGLSPDCQKQLSSWFPPAISDIVRLNTAFLESLHLVIHATESTSSALETLRQHRSDAAVHAQSILSLATCLCDWFPKFTDSYRAYTQSHPQAAQLLRDAYKDDDSALIDSLQGIGEQKLSSLLIEPIQRLPRYNLYIDNIVKQLPTRHAAIKPLLNARDIITDICDQEDPAAITASTSARFRARVLNWPADDSISGRLVTAADYTEWFPPYRPHSGDGEGMLLVFTDSLVIVEKRGTQAISAKMFLHEVESGLMRQAARPQDLQFARRLHLSSVSCLEVLDGCGLVVMASALLDQSTHPGLQSNIESHQVLRLGGFYERKAERLVEDITKATIEGRFSEAERESSTWEVRVSDPAGDTTSMLSAVFEDSNHSFTSARTSNARVRIIIDIDRHTHRPRAGNHSIRTIASISPSRDGTWRLTIDSVDGAVSPEHVAACDIVSVLRRKLNSLATVQYNIAQPSMTAAMIMRNTDVLQSIDLQFRLEEEDATSQNSRQERSYRPLSPKKLLSTFLSSSTGLGAPTPFTLKKDLPPLPASQLPPIPSLNPELPKPSSRDSRPTSKDQPTPQSAMSMRSTEHLESPLKKLEDTFSAYLLALEARKGNIVGRNLKMRASADELAINELYNSLLEDPNMMVLAAQAPVDVLFSAFEKFINIAWKGQIGQVLPYTTMQDIQSKAETLFPADFDEYFRTTIQSFSPQNQRAFKAVMKLLADLLDGTGNDGDRGMLTCAFAELLVTEGNPHDYIALIDRFVDDPDTYFGEPLDDAPKPGESSTNAHKRARSVNSASITSNTSSLRKKFGFGLSRENSKSEQESKMTSVWRTLSKSTRSDASNPGNSISKGTLHRTHSTDHDVRGPSSRPVSQDGPQSSFSEENSFVASSPSHTLGLSTIGEHPSFIPTQPPRKKRRSSLSDLKALEVSQQKSPLWSSPAARPQPLDIKSNIDKSLPNSPMPSTPSSRGGSGRFGSPSKEPLRSRLPSSFRKEPSPGAAKALGGIEPRPKSSDGKTLGISDLRPKSSDSRYDASFRKENSPGAGKILGALELRPKSSDSKADEVLITSRPSSGIPTFSPRSLSPQKAPAATATTPTRSGLAERPGAGNIVKKPSPSVEKSMKTSVFVAETGSPKKLRMQSPQKLRERLYTEQTTVTATHASLQDELSKIGDELSSTPSRMGSNAGRSRGLANLPNNNMEIAQRVLKMESQLSTQIDELTARIGSVQSDFASSLSVSESKCKKLDDLYREANGENEALYTRFNDELSRILKAVRGGEGVEELKRKLKETQDEAGKLKRENGRLKRENLGLRAQLKE